MRRTHHCTWTGVTTRSRQLHWGTERACSLAGVPDEPMGQASRELLIARKRTGRSKRQHRMSRCSNKFHSMSKLMPHWRMTGHLFMYLFIYFIMFLIYQYFVLWILIFAFLLLFIFLLFYFPLFCLMDLHLFYLFHLIYLFYCIYITSILFCEFSSFLFHFQLIN